MTAAGAAPEEPGADVQETEPASLHAVEEAAPSLPDPQRIYEKWDEGPRLVEHTQPDYPDIARKAGVEGTVTLHLVVGRDGRVEEVSIFRSTPRLIFDLAAQEAVKEWRYTPARLDGHPVRARISQTLRFVLNEPRR